MPKMTKDMLLFPKSASEALYTMYQNKAAAKIKEWESKFDTTIPSHQPYLIRLDGVAFHTFTKGLVKPFDQRLTNAMVETTKDLVQKFSAVTGYTHSDEISLVFPSIKPKDPSGKLTTHIYGGRIQKLTSVTASYASARFNFHLSSMDWENMPIGIQERMKSGIGYFDSRVVVLEDEESISECIFWRSNCDGLRNSIFAISQSYYPPKALQGKGLQAQLQMLHDDFKVNVFQDYPMQNLFGTWIKKETFESQGVHGKTGEIIQNVIRTRLRQESFNWADWTEQERNAFTLSKFWI